MNAVMKHEPKTMKKKADLMLKRGTISEAQHKKLHAKADVEIAKAKPLSAKGDGGDAATDIEVGKDTPAADDPSKNRRKPGADNLERGEPADPDL